MTAAGGDDHQLQPGYGCLLEGSKASARESIHFTSNGKDVIAVIFMYRLKQKKYCT